MKVAPPTEHLFVGAVVKFDGVLRAFGSDERILVRELRGWQNVGETGLILAVRECTAVSVHRWIVLSAPSATIRANRTLKFADGITLPSRLRLLPRQLHRQPSSRVKAVRPAAARQDHRKPARHPRRVDRKQRQHRFIPDVAAPSRPPFFLANGLTKWPHCLFS